MEKHLSLAAATAFLVASGAVAAQSAPAWPLKPVTIVVGVQPGAATDIEARLYAQKMTENIGRTVIVVERHRLETKRWRQQCHKAPRSKSLRSLGVIRRRAGYENGHALAFVASKQDSR